MSARNLLLRQESEDSSSIISHSPSISSLNRLRDTFRRTESLSSQLSSIVSNAASAASGAVLGTSAAAATSDASSASTSQSTTPVKKKKPGEYNFIFICYALAQFAYKSPIKTVDQINSQLDVLNQILLKKKYSFK